MNKKWIWIAGLGLVAIIVVASITKGGKQTASVDTTQVSERDITELVSVSGKIQPEFEVKISADVSARIIRLGVKDGDRVEKGQFQITLSEGVARPQ